MIMILIHVMALLLTIYTRNLNFALFSLIQLAKYRTVFATRCDIDRLFYGIGDNYT